MKKIINFIKRDFSNVKDALECMRGKEVPMAFAIPYYIIVLIVLLPLIPVLLIWAFIRIKIALRKADKYIKEMES